MTSNTIIIGIIILILSIIILFISLDSIEPLEYGITYNIISKTIGTDIYSSGRYIIGPFNHFIIYPANLITVEFSNNQLAVSPPLQTRTKEGLSLALHVSFQYQVIKGKIPDLYNMANVNYQSTIIRMSRDVIMKVGGVYNAESYWLEREKISIYMKEILTNELKAVFVECMGLQILRIDLPQNYEDSIVSTQVEVQKTNMRKFEQEAELIRQNANVLVSEAQQRIKVIDATANAESTKLKQFALAQANQNMINAETEIYSSAKIKLGLQDRNLTNYIYYTNLLDQGTHEMGKMLVGLKNSIIGLDSLSPK